MRRKPWWTSLAVALVALAALSAWLSAPLFWKRYAVSLAAPAPAWYQPRERVAGGNEPPAPRVAPALESLDPHALEEAAEYSAAHDARALIVSRREHIVFERYWDGTAFDTLADAGSFTRLLAALATGTALSHRRIGWPDQPVGYFLGAWSHEARGAITVRNLLQMSSGLAAIPPGRAPWSPAARWSFGTDLASLALAEPLAGAPGRTFAEQGADPQLLALVLERATGERYASYLSQALWRRIGAGDAWLYLDRPGGTAHADCCMLARQGDWIRIAELLLRDGNYRGYEIIRPGWVKLMRLPARANPDHGAFLRLSAGAPGKPAWAAADTFAVDGGGGNRLWLVPSLGIAVLRLGGGAGGDFDEARIPNLIVRGARDFQPGTAPAAGGLPGLVPGH